MKDFSFESFGSRWLVESNYFGVTFDDPAVVVIGKESSKDNWKVYAVGELFDEVVAEDRFDRLVEHKEMNPFDPIEFDAHLAEAVVRFYIQKSIETSKRKPGGRLGRFISLLTPTRFIATFRIENMNHIDNNELGEFEKCMLEYGMFHRISMSGIPNKSAQKTP